jgi:hypothetical protein
MLNAVWKKLSQLKVGQKIAVPDDKNGVLWDEIVEIKKVGREMVYDIEIEDTHNFVGNRIFAHNTYIMNGNVGIGTTGPGAKLQVDQSGAATAANYGASVYNAATSSTDSIAKYGLYISSTGTWNGIGATNYGLYVDTPTGGTVNTIALFHGSLGDVSINDQGAILGFSRSGANYITASGASGSLAFQTGGSNTRFSMDSSGNVAVNTNQLYVQQSSGNVGIGTTNPSFKLQVNGTMGIDNPTVSTTGDYLCWNDTTHEVEAGTTCTLSSQRFKTDIIPLSGSALKEVLALQPISFRFKDGFGDNGATTQVGFLAEQAATVDPRLVALDKNGLPGGFIYQNYTAILTKAIQEQQIQLDQLGDAVSQTLLSTPTPTTIPSPTITPTPTPSSPLAQVFQNLVEFVKEVIFKADVTFLGRATFNSDTAGFAIIPKDQRKVDVTFDKEYSETPIVTATLLWDISQGTASVADKIDGFFVPAWEYAITNLSNKGFTIILGDKAVTDIKFSWMATAVKDAKTFKPLGAEPTQAPSTSPSPTPTPVSSSPTPSPSAAPIPSESPTLTPTSSPSPTSTPTPLPEDQTATPSGTQNE